VTLVCDLERASATARHEGLLLRLLALTRVVVLCQAATALAFHWDATEGQGCVVGLLILLVLDNAALLLFHLRRGLLGSRWLAAFDVGLGMAALVVVVTLLKPAANPASDNILYPYTVATVSVIGLVYRRAPVTIAAAAATSAIYVSVTMWRFGIGSGTAVLANATTYWAWALAGWFLAHRFRIVSVELDHARQVAARQEAGLARERERSRLARELHAIRMDAALRALEQERARVRLSRSLHDNVLQTLEFMSRDGWIAAPRRS
jgi:signal transduction histidine kinase